MSEIKVIAGDLSILVWSVICTLCSPRYKIDNVIMGFVDDVSENLAIMLSYSMEIPGAIRSVDSDTNVRPLHNHVVRNVGRRATSIPCQYQPKQRYENMGYN